MKLEWFELFDTFSWSGQFFVRLFKIESLRIRFRLWNWIEGPKELFFFFFWDFADFKRIQIEPYSRKDHLEIILTNEKTNWPIVEQEQFQQKRFLLITRGQAQDNTTVNPQATRLISRQLLKLFNVNFEIIVWIVWVVNKSKNKPNVTMTPFSDSKLKIWYSHRRFENMSFRACWLKVTPLSFSDSFKLLYTTSVQWLHTHISYVLPRKHIQNGGKT